jgi:hypothetical protein
MDPLVFHRQLLEEEHNNRLGNFIRRSLVDSEVDKVPDSVTPTQVIASTFEIYGSIFLVIFAAFLLLRAKFPLTYTFNSRVLKHITPLSKHRYGSFQWISKVFAFTDEEMFEHCGMSAIVYLRFLRLGIKLSCVGIFNSFFLIPANLHGCNIDPPALVNDDEGRQPTCLDLSDRVEQISLSHVSPGSPNVWATVVAAYIIFGSAIYFIFKEFEWFTEHRHKFCTQHRPDNYTVYVAQIPLEYRSDARLLEYFQTIFSKEVVLDAKVAVNIPQLEKKVGDRKKVIEKLEHAVNLRNVKGYEPLHLVIGVGEGVMGQQVESIPEYSKELNRLNEDITSAIEKIEAKKEKDREIFQLEYELEEAEVNPDEETSLLFGKGVALSENREVNGGLDASDDGKTTKHHRKTSKFASLGSAVLNSANMTMALIGGSEDRKIRDGGFVTFSSLLAKNQCVQIIHHATPFTFYTMDAPRPEAIVWTNVGTPHKEQHVSYLLAQAGTAATCLFWTIPVSFFSSLSELESLKELIPGLDKVLEKNEWLAGFIAQLSPLMLVILTSLLPAILTVFCKKEGHVGSDSLNASLLTKLAMFMIVQIFFVQAIAGSAAGIVENIEIVIDRPTILIGMLAESVPNQVKSFIQFVQVQNFLGCGLELLRIPRVAMALIRERIGPNLTEKERNTAYMGILPMSESEEMEYPMLFAEMILYFMINLVYSCIAPIMSYILLICFGLLSLVFRHQLIYTYSRKNDDGGKLWSSAIMLLITCMVVSEFTLIGIVFLKEAFIPGVFLIPLIMCTFLFTSYIKQQHFLVTEHVPSTLCSAVDKANKNTDLSFLEEKYLQPALSVKKEYPDNSSSTETVAYGKRDESVGLLQSGGKAVANEGLEEAASTAPMEI